jgi:hypothetical protein
MGKLPRPRPGQVAWVVVGGGLIANSSAILSSRHSGWSALIRRIKAM